VSEEEISEEEFVASFCDAFWSDDTSVHRLRESPPTIEGLSPLRWIADGGMGAVFFAVDKVLNRPVAVKVLIQQPESRLQKSAATLFLRECRVLASLKHENIVQVFHAGECTLPGGSRLPFFVMERIEGGDVRQLIKRGGIGLGQVRRIMSDVCSALTVAHHALIIHRDIKPENILIDPDGVYKVADFGIARDMTLDGLAMRGQAAGTRDYLAPEVLEGKSADAQSDVYACGILFYEMLVGEIPRASSRPLSKARPDLDRSWDVLFAKATAKDRAKRFRTIDEFQQALEAISVGDRCESASVLREETQTARHREGPIRKRVWKIAKWAALAMVFGATAMSVQADGEGDASALFYSLAVISILPALYQFVAIMVTALFFSQSARATTPQPNRSVATRSDAMSTDKRAHEAGNRGALQSLLRAEFVIPAISILLYCYTNDWFKPIDNGWYVEVIIHNPVGGRDRLTDYHIKA